ncbi:unnamed protein product [Ceratitis capitata]|uniref:(Mediterranean fruit fly) hypothetical protein n=1 Tax=Ceratitis capitata TaxID=7213 RepID=A0A811UTQ2_CERCA|nr:unnamed protein product [Ceratitis capitata]
MVILIRTEIQGVCRSPYYRNTEYNFGRTVVMGTSTSKFCRCRHASIKFSSDSKWIKGSDFLRKEEQYWPGMAIKRPAMLPKEMQPAHLLCTRTKDAVIDFSRFTWVVRAMHLFRLHHNVNGVAPPQQLSVLEYEKVEHIISKLVQQEHFADEIADL